MMTATAPTSVLTAQHAITPDDLLQMGDEGKRYELVDGVLEERNVSFLSSYVAGKAYKVLDKYVEPHNFGWVLPEGTSFQCFPLDRRMVLRADTAFITLDRLTARQATNEGHCTVCPDLVVEVISPNDLATSVLQKVKDWLEAGVRLLWLIDPETKEIHCYDRDQPGLVAIRREVDRLTGEPVLPGFAIPVAELFRLPVQPPSTT